MLPIFFPSSMPSRFMPWCSILWSVNPGIHTRDPLFPKNILSECDLNKKIKWWSGTECHRRINITDFQSTTGKSIVTTAVCLRNGYKYRASISARFWPRHQRHRPSSYRLQLIILPLRIDHWKEDTHATSWLAALLEQETGQKTQTCHSAWQCRTSRLGCLEQPKHHVTPCAFSWFSLTSLSAHPSTPPYKLSQYQGN